MPASYSADLALVRRMLRGHEDAFEEFFERYFAGLYRFALARLRGNEHEAEEAAQAALCKAIRKIHTFRGEASLFTWLCTFCRHEIGSQVGRRDYLTGPIEDAPEILAALESLGRSGTDPESSARRSELSRFVQVTLDALPGRYGDVLEWKYVEGWTVREIAARLQVTPKAAESLLSRAREAFRDGFAAFREVLGDFAPPERA
jgi:RNA polymerase sigma-70 factor (ECF subfamily)